MKIKAHFTHVARIVVLAVPLVITTANAEAGRPQSTAITGQVRDAYTQQPLPRARVELLRAEIPIDHQFTDDQGRFRFEQLARGHYVLNIDVAGYQRAAVESDVPASAFVGVIHLSKTGSSPDLSSHVVAISEYLTPAKAREELDRARKAARQDCAKAIPHFENGLRGFDRDASAHNDLGNCYRKLGDLDRAAESFKRAMALSDSIYIALNLAEVYCTQKRFKEAEAVLLEVIQQQQAAGDAYYGLSLVYTAAGDFDFAETAALQAHTKRHSLADVHLVLATLYAKKNQESDYRRELELYLKEEPNGAMAGRVRELLKRPMN